MCPLFVALKLSKTIKAIEAVEFHFQKLSKFEYSESLSDLKFKKIEALESFIGTDWFIAGATSVPIYNKYQTSNGNPPIFNGVRE